MTIISVGLYSWVDVYHPLCFCTVQGTLQLFFIWEGGRGSRFWEFSFWFKIHTLISSTISKLFIGANWALPVQIPVMYIIKIDGVEDDKEFIPRSSITSDDGQSTGISC